LDNNITSERKKDHIELAFLSQTLTNDDRFYYEPFLAPHPTADAIPKKIIANKTLQMPLWVSSMTGGTKQAGIINKNLAKACKDFGMGIGLGSCRIILKDNTYFQDFNIRPIMGDDLPLFANLGIAQIEEIIEKNEWHLITDLIKKIEADGLIIHVNPLQELLQPEGDLIKHRPIDTIKKVLDKLNLKIIVKEVGQGFGPASFMELFQLPIEAIEFGAHGGTNFATLELLRQDPNIQEMLSPITKIGHNAQEMLNFSNAAIKQLGEKAICKNIIISGGIKNYMDGFYLTEQSKTNAIFAQASAFLKHAIGDYEQLFQFCELQKKGLETCYQYLKIKP